MKTGYKVAIGVGIAAVLGALYLNSQGKLGPKIFSAAASTKGVNFSGAEHLHTSSGTAPIGYF